MVRPSFKNTSTGIAPAAAVQALPAKDRQLFLRSTSQESFAGLRHPVPRSCLKYSSQGLGQILHLGEKRTIHAGVPLKVADLAQRSMCEYTSNFREVPLLGAGIDRQLAESFREANRSSQRLAAIPSAKSSYTEAFGPFTRHEQRHARQPPCTPAADRRAEDSIGFGSTKSSETSSLAHSSHGKLPLDLLETTSRPVVKDHLGASAQGTKSAFRTTYQSHFKPQTAPASYCRPLLTSQVKFSWEEKRGSGSISEV